MLEQPFIDPAEFFDIEIAIVDPAGDTVAGDLAQRADRGQERSIPDQRPSCHVLDAARRRIGDIRARTLAEQSPAQWFETEEMGRGGIPERIESDQQTTPEIVVAVVPFAHVPGGNPQAVDTVVPAIPGDRGRIGFRSEQETPLLGHHEKQETIDQAEELAVVVIERERTI